MRSEAVMLTGCWSAVWGGRIPCSSGRCGSDIPVQ